MDPIIGISREIIQGPGARFEARTHFIKPSPANKAACPVFAPLLHTRIFDYKALLNPLPSIFHGSGLRHVACLQPFFDLRAYRLISVVPLGPRRTVDTVLYLPMTKGRGKYSNIKFVVRSKGDGYMLLPCCFADSSHFTWRILHHSSVLVQLLAKNQGASLFFLPTLFFSAFSFSLRASSLANSCAVSLRPSLLREIW